MPSLGLKLGLSALSAAISSSASSLLAGLISWHSLDEASGNAIDANGNYDLTQNGTVGATTGQVNGARNGFGVSNYFSSSNSAFDLTSTFYFACWINTPDITATQVILAKWLASGDHRSYLLRVISSNLQFIVSDNGTSSSTTLTSSGGLSNNTWQFVEVYHNAATDEIGLAIDGGAFITLPHSTNVFSGGADFTVGFRLATTTNFLGAIDELVLYNRVPSSTERAELLAGNGYPG